MTQAEKDRQHLKKQNRLLRKLVLECLSPIAGALIFFLMLLLATVWQAGELSTLEPAVREARLAALFHSYWMVLLILLGLGLLGTVLCFLFSRNSFREIQRLRRLYQTRIQFEALAPEPKVVDAPERGNPLPEPHEKRK